MLRFIKYPFFLAILLVILSTSALAGPSGNSPEGGARNLPNGLPFGCRATHEYVNDPKCSGGRCLVANINCCGNGVTDSEIRHPVLSDRVERQREYCDGEDYCRGDCTFCGDNVVNSDEVCDGPGVNNGRACRSSCDGYCDVALTANRYVVVNGVRTLVAQGQTINLTTLERGNQDSSAYITVEVTNPGCVTYTNLQVISDNGIVFNYATGDVNNNQIFDLSETWVFIGNLSSLDRGTFDVNTSLTAEVNAPGGSTVRDDHNFTLNINGVCGDDVKDGNEACDFFDQVKDGQVCAPGCGQLCDFGLISRRVFVSNGSSQTVAQGQVVSIPYNAEISLELYISNPGCISYSDVAVNGDLGAFTFVEGDGNSDGKLNPGENWVYKTQRQRTTTLGQIQVDSSVTAKGDIEGNPPYTDDHTFWYSINVCTDGDEALRLFCGNGRLDCSEQCDLGARNGVFNSGCSATCRRTPRCGNYIVESGEQCDLGVRNGATNSGCSATCQRAPRCGNYIVEQGEQCDRGANNGDRDATFAYSGKRYYCDNSCDRELAACVWVAAYGMEITAHTALINNVVAKMTHGAHVPSCLKRDWPVKSGCVYHDWGAVHTVKCASNTGLTLAKFLGVPATKRNAAHYYYMDQNCNYVSAPSKYNLCGYAGIVSTPISLIFGESAELYEDNRVVQFDLNAQYTGNYTIWRASESSPLLVFDPERTGKVTAENLFGNWTFGGRGSNPFTKTSLNNSETRQPWNNGYEPLGILDADGDGKVSGSELKPLSLWFDKDRDAIVDEGEIKTVEDVGITALFYKDAAQRGGSTDLELTVGYTINKDGKEQSGPSIDWYSDLFDSERSAADALLALSPQSEQQNEVGSVEEISDASDPAMDFSPVLAGPVDKDLSGFWTWTLESEQDEARPGVFALQQSQNGMVTGYSVAEALLAKNEDNLNSVLKLLQVEGRSSVQAGKALKFTFTSKDNDSGNVLTSTAELSADGMTLKGVTKQGVSDPNVADSKGVTIEYSWIARRVLGENSKPINSKL